MTLNEASEILGVRPTVSEADLKEAYRDLAKVWHPDRFPNDARLRSKAQDKLKEINAAYYLLKDFASASPTAPNSKSRSERSHPSEPASRQVRRPPSPSAQRRDAQRSMSSRPNTKQASYGYLHLIWWSAILGIILVGGAISEWRPQPASRMADEASAPKSNSTVDSNSTRKIFSIEELIAAQPHANKPKGFITVGSTKDEVLSIHGTPNSFDEHVWRYGLSRVYFEHGRVASWDISPFDPIKARLVPVKPVGLNRPFFTVGSTKDEVLSIEGTPAKFSDNVWHYGLSRVYFEHGRVASWDISPFDPIKARLVPGNP